MDLRLTTMLPERHANRRHDEYLEREYVVYRHPDDHLWPQLVMATRRRLSTALLTMGARLSDESLTDSVSSAEPPVRSAQ
jgi:hypothetical protein